MATGLHPARTLLAATALAGLLALAPEGALAHDDEAFEADRQPPYAGAGWRADEGGSPPESFPSSGVQLMSWIPLLDFSPSTTSGNDCWGYTSPSGREYALIGLSNGTGVVEVTDPGNAQIVSFVSGVVSSWRDIKTYQHYAYVVSEGGGGIQVLDLAQIDSGVVTLVNTITAGGRLQTHNVAVDETSGYLYRVGGGTSPVVGLRVYDLADPATPSLAGQWNDRYCHDAQILKWPFAPYLFREIAFCYGDDTSGGGNPGIDILDVTDKSNITRIGGINLAVPPIFDHVALFAHQGWLSPDRRLLYSNDEVDEGTLGTPTLTRVIDITDLTAPFQTAIFGNGGTARDHNLYTLGRLIFEANYRSGLRVFDASDPVAPVEIAYFDTYPADDLAAYNGLWNVYPYFPSGTIIGSDLERGLFVWQLEQPPLPPVEMPALSDRGVAIFFLLITLALALRRSRGERRPSGRGPGIGGL